MTGADDAELPTTGGPAVLVSRTPARQSVPDLILEVRRGHDTFRCLEDC